jgi:hypothetical protein
MVGILVHGDNHFIVRGPLPDRDTARAVIRLVHHSDWSDNRTLAHLDNRCFTSLGDEIDICKQEQRPAINLNSSPTASRDL